MCLVVKNDPFYMISGSWYMLWYSQVNEDWPSPSPGDVGLLQCILKIIILTILFKNAKLNMEKKKKNKFSKILDRSVKGKQASFFKGLIMILKHLSIQSK